jgi:cysteinyl-tRNA synthetase
MDTLIRVLKASKLKPKWVMNVTDVGHLVSDADEGEDKLEKGAKREGKTAWEVAKFYTEDFLHGMRTLNMLEPDEMPRATDHIAEQIDLIQKLEAKGYTYTIDDGVYYDTSKFEGYSAFARLDLGNLEAGARVAVNPQKRNPTDFALWKFSPKDHQRDMEWGSPWGKGFPGWHIECSAMGMKYLGETLDIHTGGIDHVPVHHTNEIAQSEAATGKRFATMWMHGNHVTVNGEKISKSLGNGIRLQEIMERDISPEAVRLHVLESHYRSQSRFSWESLEAARNRLSDYRAMAALQWQPHEGEGEASSYMQVASEILECLQDDLNTPEALARLSSFSDEVKEQGISSQELPAFESLLSFLDATLGLKLTEEPDITDAQKQLVHDREAARERRYWDQADELRDQLAAQNIGIRDTDNGSIWYRLI